ncbi:MAG: glucosaminidase domain-containing protein [Betaproteobacteria bacterium]
MPVSPALLPSARPTEPLGRPVGGAARAAAALPGGFAQTLAEVQTPQPRSDALSEVEVRPGDTLSGIVSRHLQLTQPQRSASPMELFQMAAGVARDNGIANLNLILPGQVIDVSSLDAAPKAERQAAAAPVSTEQPARKAAPAVPSPLARPLAVAGLPASAVPNASAFLVRHAEAAQRVQAASGIPATYMLSQAALETGWGRQEIRAPDGRNSFNLFGIRAGGNWQGPTVKVWTTEHINGSTQRMLGEFRAYSSYEESFADYARLIGQQPRYAKVMQNLGDPNAFAAAMQRSGYATGPRYASALASVIDTTQRLQGMVPEVQAALRSPTQSAPLLAQAGDAAMAPAAQVLQLRFNAIAPMPASAEAGNAARMARQRAYASLDLPMMP